jgi:hypothetical protein
LPKPVKSASLTSKPPGIRRMSGKMPRCCPYGLVAQERIAVFAPLVAKPTAAALTTGKLAPQRRALAHPTRYGSAEPVSTQLARPSRSASDARGEETEQKSDRSARRAPAAAWDFSRIPLFAPERRAAPAGHPFAVSPAARIIQPKLAVGAVDDPLEHEADRIADQVMRMPAPAIAIGVGPVQISRKCAACEEEVPILQSKRAGAFETAGEAPRIVHDVVRSPGQPLDPATRAFMEPRFGHQFSKVRVHTDEEAARSAAAVGAAAYTVGSHIAFAAGRHAPGSASGRQLFAHELAHVVQQAVDSSSPNGNALFPGNMLQRQENPSGSNAASAPTQTAAAAPYPCDRCLLDEPPYRAQPSPLSCWAAATTMLVSSHDSVDYSIEAVLTKALNS